MNITEENSAETSRQNVFGCSSTQWSQVPPQYMPWGHSPTSPPASLVTFNAQPQLSNLFSPQNNPCNSFSQNAFTHCKRKANLDISVPRKQHITEEKMAAHMSRLHISTENEQISNVEDSLSRQKRLYVCEEMRKLQNESILPSSILGRLERPCMAVMLWQPPAKIPNLLSNTSSHFGSALVLSGGATPRNRQEEDENENNVQTIDLNNMEMDS